MEQRENVLRAAYKYEVSDTRTTATTEELTFTDIESQNFIALKNENRDLTKKCIDLAAKIESMEAKYKYKCKKLSLKVQYYKKKLSNISSSKKHQTDQMIRLLKSILTENRIDLLLRKKRRVNWTSDEISSAFTLRYYSQKAYLYVKNKLKYPLPGLSTLRRWALKININEGILNDVFKFLSLAGENLTDFERTVVLAFDEIKLKSIYEYEVVSDKIVGPHSQLQVVMARGLFSKWKQPIFIGYDQKMTKEILLEIITQLSKIAYNVVACVSDCGSSNVGLWKNLGVDYNHTFFTHPITNKNIYMFADAPHLLKLLRNWLIDTGFILNDKSIINKKPLLDLIEHTDEVNVVFKISMQHITVEKAARQKVRMAAQLLSNTVAQSSIRYKPGSDPELAIKVANFINIVNTWFDIFNSYVPKGTIPTKCAFGTHFLMQEEQLDKMFEMVKTIRAIGKNTLQIFQKGILMSINSLKHLFTDLKSDFPHFKYICTHKLNQDCLEDFFFQIRSRGPDEHPTPIMALKRIRLIIIGKNNQ
jgi:Transposase protein